MNSSAPSASSPARRQTAPQTPPDRLGEPPRKQAETRAAKDRFAAKLEREGSGGESKASARAKTVDGSFAKLPGPPDDARGNGRDSEGREGFAQSAVAVTAQSSRCAAAAIIAPGGIDPTMLQRIAAQIAESWPSSAAQEAWIQFPDGALAESALVRREPDGSVAIRIAGMDPLLSVRQSARVQIELANALALRQLRVGSLSFERAEADQRSLDSAISRAV